MLSDCHAHLEAYEEAALPGILGRAEAAGVGMVLGAGLDLPSSRRSALLSARFPSVYGAIGLHPCFLPPRVDKELLEGFRRLALANRRVVAISEIGLDSSGPSAARQRDAFRRMVRLARELGLPIFLHSVGDHEACFSVLQKEGALARGVVMHYFQGDRALAARCLELGMLISVGKPMLRERRLQEVIARVPLERLLLETDSYPEHGRSTEPADVRLVAEKLAELKGVTLEEIARTTIANLLRLLFPPGGGEGNIKRGLA